MEYLTIILISLSVLLNIFNIFLLIKLSSLMFNIYDYLNSLNPFFVESKDKLKGVEELLRKIKTGFLGE